MRSLRARLALSHTLPLLLVTPLMGIALIFVLEAQVILMNFTAQLRGQARLIAHIAQDYPQIWEDRAAAHAFVERFSSDVTARVILLTLEGHLLVSSDARDAPLQGQTLDLPGLSEVRAGATSVERTYRIFDLEDGVAEVMAPVFNADEQVVGVIRLTHELEGVYQRFQRLRSFVALVLGPGLLLGLGLGLFLALNLERPLQQVAEVMRQATAGEQFSPLPEAGPAEIRIVARAFNALIERLHALERARRQLLANLVHELARPLGGLSAATHALQIGADDDATMRPVLLNSMEAELQRLQRLLDDLARLYEEDFGGAELHLRPMPLHDWLQRVLATWQQAAEQKGVAWHAAVPDSLPTLLIDPDRLGQALGNLLSNAVKYTPAGGAVTVVTEQADDEVSIRVSDSGPGIDPQEQTQIFEPYYRGREQQRFPQGMGLGLTIARDLVAAHGGQLELESAPGGGSHFVVRLKVGKGLEQMS